MTLPRYRTPRPESPGECAFALHCRADGLDLVVREYVFHPTRKWRFDFYFPAERLAVEVEGGVNGRHQRVGGFRSDCVKYCHAAMLGIRVMRVTTDMVTSGEAIEMVKVALAWEAKSNG